MNKFKKITPIFIMIIIALIVIYDIIIIALGGTESSISHTLNVWAYKFPSMVFALGFVFGHLFWRTRPTPDLIKLESELAETKEKLKEALGSKS